MSCFSEFTIRCRDLRTASPRRRVHSRRRYKTIGGAWDAAREWARWHPRATHIWIEDASYRRVATVR